MTQVQARRLRIKAYLGNGMLNKSMLNGGMASSGFKVNGAPSIRTGWLTIMVPGIYGENSVLGDDARGRLVAINSENILYWVQ